MCLDLTRRDACAKMCHMGLSDQNTSPLKRELACNSSGNVNWGSHYEQQCGGPLKH